MNSSTARGLGTFPPYRSGDGLLLLVVPGDLAKALAQDLVRLISASSASSAAAIVSGDSPSGSPPSTSSSPSTQAINSSASACSSSMPAQHPR